MLLVHCLAEDLIPFDELWSRAEMLQVGPIAERVTSIADLIKVK